jgi:hypothetical protein
MTETRRKTALLLAPRSFLEDPLYRERLKRILREIGVSQRDFPTFVQDMLLYADMNGILIVRKVGTPLVDDVLKDERYLRLFYSSLICKNYAADSLLELAVRLYLMRGGKL